MAARKKSNNLLYLILLSLALALAVVYSQNGNKFVGLFGTPTPTPKPVVTSGPVSMSGPVGNNILIAKSGPISGQVTLSWTKYYTDTDKYSVVYGLSSGKYTYGALNVVSVSSTVSNYSYIVKSLIPGKRYYFAVVPQKNGKSVPASGEVSLIAP